MGGQYKKQRCYKGLGPGRNSEIIYTMLLHEGSNIIYGKYNKKGYKMRGQKLLLSTIIICMFPFNK
jgi:hypothetical protein